MRCRSGNPRCGSFSCYVHNCQLRGQRKFMKTNKTRQMPMPECEATFEKQIKTAAGQAEYQPLVRLITQVLDAAVSGEDVNLRIGATRSRNALIVTLYQEGEASYASGLDWQTLLEQVAQLL